MVEHSIKAHMEVSTKQRTQDDVIAKIAEASRAVDQMQCADSHERFAHRIMAAMKIVMEAARASTYPVKQPVEEPQTAQPQAPVKPVMPTEQPADQVGEVSQPEHPTSETWE